MAWAGFSVLPVGYAAEPQQPAAAIPATQPVQAIQPAIDGGTDGLATIMKAPDPSAVVDAYARAITAGQEIVPAESAYLRRLVELGLPEMAETQARDLTAKSPRDGLAWAVRAYMDARKSVLGAAVANIGIAVQYAPDDPFVLRTAGQILAWYDQSADRDKLVAAAKTSAEKVRKALEDKPAFADAYRLAKEAYAGNTQQGAAMPPEGAYPTYSEPSTYNYNTYNTYGAEYGDYFPYAPYASYYEPWWPASYWWPTSFVIVNRDFRFHHFDHHFDHH